MTISPANDPVIAAAERLLPGGDGVSVDGRPWLVSVISGETRSVVRQLDPKLTSIRVELIHEFLVQPDVRQTSPLIAHDRTGTQAFDARTWIPGTTCAESIVEADWKTLHLPAALSIDQLGMIAGSLAAFHRTGMNSSILARAPNFKVKDALIAVRRSIENDERWLAREIRKESRARRWLSAARPLLTNAEQALEQAGFLRDEPAVIAHLELWGSHIVDENGRNATFLDCAAIGAAPAAVDIAQLIARNGAWSDERVERVLQRYADEFAISPPQRRSLPWLTALDAIATCGGLLVRAHNERNPLAESDRRTALNAADQQIDLLASLAAAFIPSPKREHYRPGRRPRRDAS